MKRIVVVVKGELELPGVPLLRIIKTEAQRRGVVGEARLKDGVLYAVLEGEDEAVEHLVRFIPMASPAVKIREIETREEPYTGLYQDFTVF